MFSSNTSAVSADANYIEDVFSTYLYTGNSSTQTIANGIDLSGKGGLVWAKQRNGSSYTHTLADTARGNTKYLYTSATDAEETVSTRITAFGSTGYDLGANLAVNGSANTYASWTFRKQPKFFDVVTYVGDGTTNRTVAHNLGSTPGCVICKATDASGTTYAWGVWHRGNGTTAYSSFELNSTSAATTDTQFSAFTSTTFKPYVVNNFNAHCNQNGVTYVAYLFAHNAGGFGLTGTDNVISCGSVAVSSGGQYFDVNLGYEPQWLLIKGTATSNWEIYDSMRGLTNNDLSAAISNSLRPNTSDAENNTSSVQITSTGFRYWGNSYNSWGTMIYIAIRRGPMKTPTTGTSVFNPVARTGTGTNPTVVTTNNNPDLLMSFPRTASPSAYGMCFWDKLRGISPMLQSSITDPETNTNTARVLQGWLNTGYQAGADFIEGYLNYSGSDYVNYPITRAPGFFDVVCYTGTGVNRTVNHNLGVVPELMIVKSRSGTRAWGVYVASEGPTKYLRLETTGTPTTSSDSWNDTTPTASVFSLGAGFTNDSAGTYVAYLFASCPGVSKVGSYTGTGALQTINCGFTGGARFVLIKRTDSTGGWFTYDSARGITSGNDPYLLMNSAVAEVTGTNYVDTTSVGFQVTAAAPAGLNANGGTYIFLAIA